MTRPVKVDQVARSLANRAALVAGGLGHEGEALEVVRDLHFILESGEYELRMRTADPRLASTHGIDAPAFAGRPMEAKFPSRCAVCSNAIEQGDAIVYDGQRPSGQKTAHLRCAEVSA